MRAATAGELTKLRSDGQAATLRLAFAEPPLVFQARVNGTFPTTDQVQSIPYDTVTLGAYTDLEEGMTLLVGSSAGSGDLGQARIKAGSTSSTLAIGRTSDIPWADNLYLTALREFALWAKQPLLNTTGTLLDDNTTYTDQLTLMRPVPLMGPDALLQLTGATVVYQPSAAASWAPNSTITGYSWSCSPAAASLTGGTTATPTITFNATGTYTLKLTVTAANGKTTTGHRTVRVVGGSETPITEFTLDQLQGDTSAGGWTATVTLFSQAEQSSVRDRAKVFIYASDTYGGVEGSIGQYAGLEHQVMVGWIIGESIEYDAQIGSVTFTIAGPAAWLQKLGSTATYIEAVTNSPANWNQIKDVNLAKVAWYFLSWRSTAAEVMEIPQPSINYTFGGITAGMGTIWSQITDAASNRLLCEARCDRYGTLHLDRDPQVMTTAQRNALPIIMDFTQADCQEKIDLERRTVPESGVLELSGLYFSGGSTGLILSRAAGWAMKHYGKPETRDRIVASSQADANLIAGSLLAKSNNPYPRVTLKLAQNNRMLDIGGAAWCRLSIAAGDTPRGITWTNQRLIPRKITLQYDPKTGAPTTVAEFEPEATPEIAVTVDVPTIGTINVPTQPGLPGYPIGPFTSPFSPIIPPVVPKDPDIPDTGPCEPTAPANGPFPFFVKGTVVDNRLEPIYAWMGGWSAQARGSGASNITTLVLNCRFDEYLAGNWVEAPAATWGTAYLLDRNGSRLATGTWSGTGQQRTITFAPPANTRFYGIEIGVTGAVGAITASGVVFQDPQEGFYGYPVLADEKSLTTLSDGSLFYSRLMTIDVDTPRTYAFTRTNFTIAGVTGGGVVEVSGDMHPLGGWLTRGLYGWFGMTWTDSSGAARDMLPFLPWEADQDPEYPANGTTFPVDFTKSTYTQHGGPGYSAGFIERVYLAGVVQQLTTYTRAWMRNLPSRRLSVFSGYLYNLCN